MEEKKKVPAVWNVFACIGFGIGIGTIATCWIFSLALTTGPIGIVFSALGMKSVTHHGKAKTGLTLSIIGTALAFVIMFIWLIALSTGSIYY